MKSIPLFCLIITILLTFSQCKKDTTSDLPINKGTKTQYLIFQLFTYGPNPMGSTQPWSSDAVRSQINDILVAVGETANADHSKQVGFAIGPISLDHTDEYISTAISESFNIALEKNVAVEIHIDESMFWMQRSDLWNNVNNVEWSDWNQTIIPHRYVGWIPITLAPQMCYNSLGIRQEVGRIAKDVIGVELKKGIDLLKANGKEHLFAGVVVGWETHLADYRYIHPLDSAANSLAIPHVQMGYNALTNLGYSSNNQPPNIDSILERVVHDYAELWAQKINEAGVPSNRIYTHIAFVVYENEQDAVNQLTSIFGFPANLLEIIHTTPSTAYNNYSRPGYSTYPVNFKVNNQDGLLSKILTEQAKHGNHYWASSEGANVILGSTTSQLTWEEYLSGMYKNGASLVNIFGFHDYSSPYGAATRSTEAIVAYKKFLNGEL
jgi:hypothetical protein